MFSRSAWKPVLILAMVLIVGFTASCLLLRKLRERKEFVGKVDPISGKRCRFTVSPRWQWNVSKGPTVPPGTSPSYGCNGGYMPGFFVDKALFSSPPLDSISQWWYQLVLHKPVTPRAIPAIVLYDCPVNDFPIDFHFDQGYPDPVWIGDEPKHTQYHLRIDGFPATVISGADAVSGKPCQYADLFVYDPSSSILYKVGGIAEDADSVWFHREMQAIIDSFHLEKVKHTSGSVR